MTDEYFSVHQRGARRRAGPTWRSLALLFSSLLASACGGDPGADEDVTRLTEVLEGADVDGRDVQSADEVDGADALGSASFPLLNVNNEYLPYGSRYGATTGPFWGQITTAFADVTGDGQTDAIAVNDDRIYVRRASNLGLIFNPNEQWTNVPFWGGLGTFFADVTGDRKADAIADDASGIVVWRSTGSAFNPVSELWNATGLAGARGTFLADVNGDAKADLIAVGNDRVWVRLTNSGGTRFLDSQAWTSGAFWGQRATAFADVTGDGKADAIAVNDDKVYVRRSTGLAFAPTNEAWTSIPSYGNVATFVTDVSADGLADLVAVNSDGLWMARSNRFHFGAWQLLADQASAGTPFFADINNDKRADQIEVTSTSLQVSRSRTRDIKLRFVQFRNDSAVPVHSNAVLDSAIAAANSIYAAAGIRFVRAGSHIVNSPELATIDYVDETKVPASVLALAKQSFNPSCDVSNVPSGYVASLDLHMSEMWQVNWVGTRCALAGELLIYVANIGNGPNTGFVPDYGKTAFLTPGDMGNIGSWVFPHELGHVLGLDHPWVGLSTDPQTHEWGKRSLIWDHVYAHQNGAYITFRSRAEAAAYEASLLQIAASPAWWCPDASVPCPTNAPLGTMIAQVDNPSGADTWFSTSDKMLSGLSLVLPDRRLTLNVMHYGLNNNPSDLSNRQRALSEAQIEHIHRVLTFNMNTCVTDTWGNVIPADRPLLGR